MKTNTELILLEQNYLEMLTSYLEGATKVSTIFEFNEQIYSRPPETLSKVLRSVATKTHELKTQTDRGEGLDKDKLANTVCDVTLALASPH